MRAIRSRPRSPLQIEPGCQGGLCGRGERVEETAPQPDNEYGIFNEEEYEVALVRYKHALHRLQEAFPDLDEQHHTRPCPCGRGALAMWPWVVQNAQGGFCGCWKAGWELVCWRSDWEAAANAEHGWRY